MNLSLIRIHRRSCEYDWGTLLCLKHIAAFTDDCCNTVTAEKREIIGSHYFEEENFQLCMCGKKGKKGGAGGEASSVIKVLSY